MKKILLANIGNRNIEIEGIQLNKDFREQTQKIIENFNEFESKIRLHIIPLVINEVKDSLSHIILFYTDSPENERKNQDTLFAADIIKRKLSELYPFVEIRTLPIKCKVTDENELLTRYRNYIKKLQNEFPEHSFVLCDTGGTSQLKFALKIVCEFAFEENQLECYNVNLENIDNRSSKLTKYKAVEYKKIILAEQIIRLLDTLNYDSIFLLAGQNSENIINKESKFLIDLGILAVNMDVKKLFKYINSSSNKVKTMQPIKDFIEKKWYQYPEWIKNYIKYDDYIHICLATDAAKCYSLAGKYGLAVLYYHIAIENIFDSIIQSITKTDIRPKEKWEILKSKISDGIYKFNSRYEKINYNINTPSIPFKIEFIRSNINSKEIYKLLDAYESLNSVYMYIQQKAGIAFDSIRNKFAHEGRILSFNEFNTTLPVINELKTFIGISDRNFFETLNNNIRKSLL